VGSGRRERFPRYLPLVLLPAALGLVLVYLALFAVIVPGVRQSLLEFRKQALRDVEAPVHHELEWLDDAVQRGDLELAEAQQRARAYLRSLRYGDDGLSYFWIHDLDTRMIMHPYRPELEGRILDDYADPEGTRLFREAVDVVQADSLDHDGFIRYVWQWQGDPGRQDQKLSYVRLFAPWGWIIGSGVYLHDLEAETAAFTRNVTLMAGGVIALVAVLTGWLVWMRRRSEQRLADAAQELQVTELQRRAILDNTFARLYVLRADGSVRDVNATALAACGARADDLRGRPLWETASWRELPEERDQVRSAVAAAGAGEFVRCETRQRDRTGTVVDVDLAITPVWRDDGQVDHLIAEGRDVSQAKREEAERRRLEADLREARRHEAVGQLAGGVAHDFNNLLGSILGNAELLRDDLPAGSRAREDLDGVIRAANAGARLTRELLSFARRGRAASEPVDVHALLGDLVHLLARTAGNDVDIVHELAARQPVVRIDPGALQSALLNLGLNACQAMPGGGRLTFATRNEVVAPDGPAPVVGAYPRGECLAIQVSDTGHGMTDAVRERAFESFFTTREGRGGSGLGLASVRACVEAHDGALDLRTAEGAGTTFTIHLPLRRDDRPAGGRATGGASSTSPAYGPAR
jgi:PAS domain S-box-containing protein